MSDKHSIERLHQLEKFFTAHIGDGWQTKPITFLSGWDVIEAMWPMNDVFRAHHVLIASLPYEARYESAADDALGALASGIRWSATSPAPGAWRVLYERHIQSMTLAAANHAQDNARFVPVPQALAASHYCIASMLQLQWAMKPPFPIKPAASFPWPEGSQPGSLLRH